MKQLKIESNKQVDLEKKKIEFCVTFLLEAQNFNITKNNNYIFLHFFQQKEHSSKNFWYSVTPDQFKGKDTFFFTTDMKN